MNLGTLVTWDHPLLDARKLTLLPELTPLYLQPRGYLPRTFFFLSMNADSAASFCPLPGAEEPAFRRSGGGASAQVGPWKGASGASPPGQARPSGRPAAPDTPRRKYTRRCRLRSQGWYLFCKQSSIRRNLLSGS